MFERPVATLRGVGARIAERLAKLGVTHVGDILCLLPLRYEDRTRLEPIGAVRPGRSLLIKGRVELAEVAIRRRRSLLVRIADDTGAITLRFFHFSSSQVQRLQRGSWVQCFGEVRSGPTGLEMVHPEYSIVERDAELMDTTLTPVYPTTDGLHQQRLRQLVDQALALLERDEMTDHMLGYLGSNSPGIAESIKCLHRPPRGTDMALFEIGMTTWQQRVSLEELVAHRLSLTAGVAGDSQARAIPLSGQGTLFERFTAALPFELTGAQRRVIDEIGADLARDHPMHRLLQGDVGSGKTVVAAAAAIAAAESGCQSVLMAPTELLAEQHHDSFRKWLDPLGLSVVMLSGTQSSRERESRLIQLAEGSAQIAVGTHALFQDTVRFKRLALVVVDEQHRFGVAQRLRLERKGGDKGFAPHQLIMTATPIPRTLAMTAYAGLECSVVDELPAGRLPVATVVMPEHRRPDVVARLVSQCAGGRQAYWVCPLIDESDALDSSAAAESARTLAEALPQLRIGLVHGRMKTRERLDVMHRFKEGAIDILVATTVVEVGVDVPNATLMIIENAERMGLAQLHQLRGRIGRGKYSSACLLLYKPPLSEVARSRLRAIRETSDGFEIAERDLELRGAGEVLGTRQTGLMRFRVADLARDARLLGDVVRIADDILLQHPDRVAPLVRRWIRGAEKYARV